MIRGLFVTGTDTGIGKTVSSAALFHRYKNATGPVQLRYWKPVQTGADQDDDTATVRTLARLSDAEVFAGGYRFKDPVSPHLASEREGEPISLHRIRMTLPNEPDTRWVIEGAGGVLVPLNRANKIIDLIAMLGLPALVVARTALGTINHTLLTVEALRVRSIPIAGVLMAGERNDDNRDAIEQYGKVPVIAQMPRFDPLTPEVLGEWAGKNLDPHGVMRECFE
jgi:dethiobiotin synthetase